MTSAIEMALSDAAYGSIWSFGEFAFVTIPDHVPSTDANPYRGHPDALSIWSTPHLLIDCTDTHAVTLTTFCLRSQSRFLILSLVRGGVVPKAS